MGDGPGTTCWPISDRRNGRGGMLAPAESLDIEAGGPPAAHSLFPAEQRSAGDSRSCDEASMSPSSAGFQRMCFPRPARLCYLGRQGFTQLHHAHLSQGKGHELMAGQPCTLTTPLPPFLSAPCCSAPTSLGNSPWELSQCSKKA